MSPKYLVLLLSAILVGQCVAEDGTKKDGSDNSEFKKSISKDCEGSSYSIRCLKLDIVSWVERLDEADEFSVIPGIAVVRENASESANKAEIVKELAREFPNDPDARLDAYIMKKITGYFKNHAVKLNLWDKNSLGEARGKGGGGGGKKGGGGIEMLIAAGAMMKATLFAIALKGLALLAGKALMTALIALTLSGIIGLKALTHHDHGHTTYEVVAKPIYTHSNIHTSSHEEHGGGGGGGGYGGHSGYGRSFDAPLPVGLQPGYKPEV